MRQKVTGQPVGSAFIHYVSALDAAHCMDDYFKWHEKLRSASSTGGAGGVGAAAKANSPFVLDGRELLVCPAVTRQKLSEMQAERKAEEARGGGGKKDMKESRNLYLLDEGCL